MSLADHSLRRPILVWVLTVALLVLGVVSITRLKLDFLPQMDFPFIGVVAPYPNAVPDQVEQEIARPIEEVLATLGDVREIFSESDQTGAFVGVSFEYGRSVDVLRMEVKEKLDQVKPFLPADLEDPFIFTFNSNDIPILVGRISARGRDLSGSYDLLERRVINPLRRIDGVGRVQVDGIEPKEVVIYLRMEKLIEHRVDVQNLFRLLNANNVDLSVGRVQDGRQRVAVRALGQFRSLEEVKDLKVNDAGVRLRDVAEILHQEPAPTYRRHLNGEPAIAFEIQKASGANIVEVSRRVHETLEEIRRDPALQGVDIVLFFDQAEQIKNSLRGLLESGLVGSLLAVGILFVFLRRIRPTLIISISIPFSVIATCAFLFLTHRSLNLLTMMGLMLAVGMLVDNAIVVLESISRHQERGEPAREATVRGAREVALAVTASTLTSVIVFAPVILSKGSEIFIYLSEVGITISVTMLFSLLVCLTLVPILAARGTGQGATEFRFLSGARRVYLRILRWTTLLHPKRTGLIFVPLAVVVTIGVMAATKFTPDPESERGMKQENLRLRLEFSDNVNLYRVEDYVHAVENFLIANKDSLDVESVYTFYRSNEANFGLFFPKGSSLGEDEVRKMRQWLRKSLPPLAGAEYRLSDDEEAGRGAKKLEVTLFGEDSDLLLTYAEEIRRRLALMPGLEDVRTDAQQGDDEVQIILDRQLAGKYGVSPQTVAEILGLTFRGVNLRALQGKEREVPMGVILEPKDRRNLENLRELPVGSVDGREIRLGQVARFEIATGPHQIHRESQKTAMSVNGSYEGEDYKELVRAVSQQMSTLDLPPGYSWSFGREMRESAEQQNDMLINILLALACVYFVMAALFESLLHPLVIMLCIPFAALGVVWTLMLTHTPFNMMAMIGIVILIGVVVNNGIVLIDHINNHRRAGRPRADAIVAGCEERFRPILMTAGTTVLGLIPLSLGRASIGEAQYYPMARALMGGLTVGTVLTLLVLPTFYVLAEDGLVRIRATLAWAVGKGPLPWKLPSGMTGLGGESA